MTDLFKKKNLNLLREIIFSNFKLRNEGSFFGIFWYLLNPILMLGVLYLIFSKNIGASIENFAIYVLIGIIQWNFLSSSTIDGMLSLEKYSELIKKVNFPRELLVIGSVLNLFLSHIIEWFLVIILIAFLVGLSYNILLFPFILLTQLVLSLMISFFLSAFFSYYKDIQNLWKLFLFIAWFLTPIFYLSSMIPERFSFINSINPMTQIISFTRHVFLNKSSPELIPFIITFLILFILLLISYFVFKKMIINIAERI